MKSRIDRITEAHPEVDPAAVTAILVHYYRLEWSLPDATLWDVRNTLEHVTQGLVDAPKGTIQCFAKAIEKGEI